MKRKTPEQKEAIRKRYRFPVFWNVVSDEKRYLIIKNWLTGTFRVVRK